MIWDVRSEGVCSLSGPTLKRKKKSWVWNLTCLSSCFELNEFRDEPETLLLPASDQIHCYCEIAWPWSNSRVSEVKVICRPSRWWWSGLVHGRVGLFPVCSNSGEKRESETFVFFCDTKTCFVELLCEITRWIKLLSESDAFVHSSPHISKRLIILNLPVPPFIKLAVFCMFAWTDELSSEKFERTEFFFFRSRAVQTRTFTWH